MAFSAYCRYLYEKRDLSYVAKSQRVRQSVLPMLVQDLHKQLQPFQVRKTAGRLRSGYYRRIAVFPDAYTKVSSLANLSRSR